METPGDKRFRILSCIDGSEESYRGLHYAARLGGGVDADIGPTAKRGLRLVTKCARFVLAHQQDCGGAVGQRRSIACGNRAFAIECRAQFCQTLSSDTSLGVFIRVTHQGIATTLPSALRGR